jgi:hypothetical protein
MITLYEVIDNLLPKHSFKIIEDICLNNSDFPWFLTETAYPDNGVKNNAQTSFANAMYINTHGNDPIFLTMGNILSTALGFKGFNVKEFYRIRTSLQVPLPYKKEKINNPHFDINEPHKVLLMYINDSDGDTILYNETHDYSDIDMAEYVKQNNFSIMEKVAPKRNRAIIFDGYHWHSSSTPIRADKRVVVNCNFI